MTGRQIILLCYSLQILGTATLLAFTRMGLHAVLPIYAVLFLVGTGRAFSGPASSALIPHLVPEKHFVNAVTWGGAIFQFANTMGPALGGVLFTLPLTRFIPDTRLEGAGIVYVFTLGTLGWFLILVGSLSVRPGRMEHRATSLRVVLAGFRYVFHMPMLLGSFSLDLFVVLLGGAVALMPIFAQEILHTGPRGLGMLRAAPAVGALCTSLRHGPIPAASQGGRTAVCVRGRLWRGDHCVRAVAEPVAVAGGARDYRRGRHDQRDHSRLAAATGHAAGDARPRERGEFAVRGRVERAGRIRERVDGAVVRRGAGDHLRRRGFTGRFGAVVGAVSRTAAGR